jgi:hypothetical protein
VKRAKKIALFLKKLLTNRHFYAIIATLKQSKGAISMNVEKVLDTPYVRDLVDLLTSWANEHPNEYLERWACEEILDEKTNIAFLQRDGASRIAIFHETWDFVIKFDHCEYNDSGACYREVEAYQKAKEYGIEEFLLPIAEWIDIGLPNGCLYVQQKADYLWRHKPEKLSREIEQIYRDTDDGLLCDLDLPKTPSAFIAYIIKCFGKDFVRRVVKWADKCRVNDLHGGNCGFVGETPKLLDYAGYWE